MRRFLLFVMAIALVLLGGGLVQSAARDISPEPSFDRLRDQPVSRAPDQAPDQAPDAARVFMNGVGLYEAGEYRAAAEMFMNLVGQGTENGKLYYNIGNAYFKAGDIGRAVLWYERARRLIPGDPELHFNLAYVETYVKDLAPVKEGPVRALFSWLLRPGHPVLVCLSVAGSILFFLGLFCKNMLRIRIPAFLLYTALILGGVFTIATGFDYYTARSIDRGVILPEKVSVRAGFSELSTELFELHAGSRIVIERERDDFYRIRFGDDKIGWVEKAAVGVVQ